MSPEDQSLDQKRRQLAELKLMKERLEAELAQQEAQQDAELVTATADQQHSEQPPTARTSQRARPPQAKAKALGRAKAVPPTQAKKQAQTPAPKSAPPQTAATTPAPVQPRPKAKPERSGASATSPKNETAPTPATTKPGRKNKDVTTSEPTRLAPAGKPKQRDPEVATEPRRTANPQQDRTPSHQRHRDNSDATSVTAKHTADATQEPADDQQPETTQEKTFWRPLRGAPPWLVSLILHMVALIILAIATVASLPKKEKVFSLATLDDSTETVEEISEIALEQMELEEVQELAIETQIPDPGQIEFGEVAAAETLQASDVGNLSMADTVGDIGALFGSEGKGMSELGDGIYAAVNFFGTKSNGRRFVFVVDNSNSMGRGKYETALDEMLKSVSVLSPKQQFYVIFFSDTAYRMFHPKPAERAVPATPDNKEKLRIWLYNTQMCLRTEGLDAMKAALALRPDVIYILGDGAFTDKTGRFLTAPHQRRVVINTFGMEVNPKGRTELQAIAKANGGTYKDVRTSPAMVQFAKKNPIKKNRSRGKIWGLKLPVAKK